MGKQNSPVPKTKISEQTQRIKEEIAKEVKLISEWRNGEWHLKYEFRDKDKE